MMRNIVTLFICVPLLISSCMHAQERRQQRIRISIKVVVVTAFEIGEDTGDTPGEFQNWVEKFPLPMVLSFPQGYHHFRYNAEKLVLAMVAGEGPARMASSITALANDKTSILATHIGFWLVSVVLIRIPVLWDPRHGLTMSWTGTSRTRSTHAKPRLGGAQAMCHSGATSHLNCPGRRSIQGMGRTRSN